MTAESKGWKSSYYMQMGAPFVKEVSMYLSDFKTLRKYFRRKRILISKDMPCHWRWRPEDTLSINARETFQIMGGNCFHITCSPEVELPSVWAEVMLLVINDRIIFIFKELVLKRVRHQKGPSLLREVGSLIFFNLSLTLKTLHKADRIATCVLQHWQNCTCVEERECAHSDVSTL